MRLSSFFNRSLAKSYHSLGTHHNALSSLLKRPLDKIPPSGLFACFHYLFNKTQRLSNQVKVQDNEHRTDEPRQPLDPGVVGKFAHDLFVAGVTH